MDNKPITLCGFMGCGKSSVGRLLASMLNYKFVDSDDYIVKQSGMTVPEIFEKQGEAYFRDLEHDAIVDLANGKDTIIATGGGVVTFERNTRVLRENTYLVMIDVCLPAVKERLKNCKNRPLIAGPDRMQKIERLYNERLPIYKAAAEYIVDGNGVPSEVAKRIIETVKSEIQQ